MSSFLLAAMMATFAAPGSPQTHSFLYAPDVHGNMIAFSAEGDIWLSNLKTHDTRRLTSDPGLETYPKFSPDGKEIAFEGSYNGKIDIYVMPTEGGIPFRVTYDPAVARLLGWTPDGKDLLFRSNRRTLLDAGIAPPQLFTIPWHGGAAHQLPVPQGFFAAFSPDMKQLAYVPDSNEWMNWFRYQAGEADSIWLTDLSGKHFTKLTHNIWVNTTPVWVGDKIYFVSEQSGVRNLWELDPKTQAEKQITFSTTVPVRYPSTDGHNVIYQIGPKLGMYDPETGTKEVLNIQLHSDRLHAQPEDVPIAQALESAAIGPTGSRAVIIARGQIVTVPAKDGEMHVLEDDSTQRSRNAAWSPDGKQIAFVSDKSGEEQLYVMGDQPGDKIRQVTTELGGENFRPVWSPDGKFLVIGDRQLKIKLIDVTTGKITLIDTADRGGSYDSTNQDYSFSPDSKWIAYAKEGEGWNDSVWLYNIASGEKTLISDLQISSSSPTFSPDGKFLYMIQQRNAQMAISPFNSMMGYMNPNVVTAVTLTPKVASPFLAKDDEEGESPSAPNGANPMRRQRMRGEMRGGSGPTPPEASQKPRAMEIDLDGIQNRLINVGLPPSYYSQITAISGNRLLVTDSNPFGGGGRRRGGGGLTLMNYDVDSRQSRPIAEGLRSLGNANDPLEFQVSGDGSKVLVRVGPGLQILPVDGGGAPPAPEAAAGGGGGGRRSQMPGGAIDLNGLTIHVNKVQQWHEEFDEAWRIARDFYIDPGMGGVNWNAVRTKYEAQLPSVGDESDFTNLVENMYSELSTGHCYVSGPNPYAKTGLPLGFLGANVDFDSSAGKWKISKILDPGPWNLELASPLSAQGLHVKAGDYLLDINGVPFQTDCDFEKNLLGTAGHVTSLTISSNADGSHSRVIRIVPMGSDRQLRYEDWVQSRIKYVSSRTDGQVGYLHISDMENGGAKDFAQGYYANNEKPGIIVDVRNNGGGFISYNLLVQLATKVIGFGQPRYGLGWRRASWAPLGHLVGICNQWDFSDGEQFSQYFKLLKLGPLVGHRTGGGEIGSGGGYPLSDGTSVFVPDYGSWVMNPHEWIVEGHGVEPDFPVDQDPAKVMAGDDPQLDEAIKLELEYLKAHPFKRPTPPVFPNHTGGSRSEKGVLSH